MTSKTTTIRTFYVHIVLNVVIFPQIWYEVVLVAQHFLPVRLFPQYYFDKLSYRNKVLLGPMKNFFLFLFLLFLPHTIKYKECRCKSGKICASHLLSNHRDLSVSFLFFPKQCLEENIRGKFQNNSWATFISEE